MLNCISDTDLVEIRDMENLAKYLEKQENGLINTKDIQEMMYNQYSPQAVKISSIKQYEGYIDLHDILLPMIKAMKDKVLTVFDLFE